MHSVEIVAEIGVNHDGSLSKAKELALAARDAGADLVKIQSFVPELLALPSTPKVAYQKARDFSTSHFDMLAKLALSHRDQEKLKSFCDKHGIGFFSTPYDSTQVPFLRDLGVPYMKVASADIIDLELLLAIAESGVPAIVSTGMATQEEIVRAVEILRVDKHSPTVLHAISQYPAPLASLRLGSIPFLLEVLGTRIGFSDHSQGDVAAPIAVALGAKMVEKHFTLNRDDPGPDHRASAEPETFRLMCQRIRDTELVISSYSESLSPEEQEMKMVSRKSLVSAKSLSAGTVLSRRDVLFRRPGHGIPVDQIEKWLGKKLLRNVDAFELLRPNDFE